MSKHGWSRKQDFEAFLKWFKPLSDRYENDPRPIIMPHPTSGQTAVIGGDAQQGWAAVFNPSSP